MPTIIYVPCDKRITRIIGKLIRVVLPDFDGYGTVLNFTQGDAELELELVDAK